MHVWYKKKTDFTGWKKFKFITHARYSIRPYLQAYTCKKLPSMGASDHYPQASPSRMMYTSWRALKSGWEGGTKPRQHSIIEGYMYVHDVYWRLWQNHIQAFFSSQRITSCICINYRQWSCQTLCWLFHQRILLGVTTQTTCASAKIMNNIALKYPKYVDTSGQQLKLQDSWIHNYQDSWVHNFASIRSVTPNMCLQCRIPTLTCFLPAEVTHAYHMHTPGIVNPNSMTQHN